VRELRDELPDLKEWWTDLRKVHSRALQRVAERLDNNLSRLSKMERGGAEGRPTQVESAVGVPIVHLQPIRLRTQEHEWPDDCTTTIEDR
jgi:hypothetical protein